MSLTGRPARLLLYLQPALHHPHPWPPLWKRAAAIGRRNHHAVTQGNGGTPNFSNLEMDLIPAFTGRIVIEPQNENIDRQIGKSGVAHLAIDLDFFHIANGPIVGPQTCGTDFPDGCPTVII